MGSLSVHSQLPYSTLLKSGLGNGNHSNNGSSLIGSKSCWSNDIAVESNSTDDLSNLLSTWQPYSNSTIATATTNNSSLESVDCPLHPPNPVLYWCSTCSRPVCGAAFCLKEHPTTQPALQQNGATTATSSASTNGGDPPTNANGTIATTPPQQQQQLKLHSLHPLSDSTLLIQSSLECESRSVGNLLSELYHFERKQQDLMLKLIDALQAVKEELESALINGGGLLGAGEIGEIHSLLQTPTPSNSNQLLHHYNSLSRRRSNLQSLLQQAHPLLYPNNSTQLNNVEQLQLVHQFTTTKLTSSSNISLKKQPVLGPRFYFDMEIVGVGGLGRVVIETRPDVAPRMCENFHSLVRGDRGFGFEGCVVFQCWRGESVITGDFEHQNGRGGHSIFPSGLFMPEDTRLPATRGALGMRRTQKRHDSKGLVGSQFRIILQDMPGFTGIFGHVLEGIEVVERIAECGDASGNPTKRVVVRRCGEM